MAPPLRHRCLVFWVLSGFCSVACAGSGGARPPAEHELGSASAGARLEPPVAEARPYEVVSPQGNRNDPYYWLRDDKRQDEAMLRYLRDENAYAAAVMAPAEPLRETLFAEMRSRIQEDDRSVPTFDAGYWYYTRFEAGKQQPIYARRRGTMEAPEEVLLDGNQLGAAHAFYRIGTFAVSRDGQRLAWAEDSVGRNQFELHVKDLATGALLPDTASNIEPDLSWANDGRTLYYVGKDATTLRADRVYRHVLGESNDRMVFQEPEGAYYVSLESTKSRRYVEIVVESTTNSEVRLLDADQPGAEPRVFLPRADDHLYSLDHLDGRFVMRTNRDAKNFRLVAVQDPPGDQRTWVDVIPHRADALVEDFALYHGVVAASVRSGGLLKVQVVAGKAAPHFLDATEPSYTMRVLDTPDPSSTAVRYSYDSLTAPSSVYELATGTGARTLLKRQPVPGFDPERYQSEYLHATASDGTSVPISLVYAKGTPRDGSAPLLMYGYGSYGISTDPRFDNGVVSLLDRGWVYALAHVRGGEELGRGWYEDGKLMHKRNTFTDFISAGEFLIAQKYADSHRLFALGRSAGGLLMGAVLNMRPDLYRGVAAVVPFVDVVTTMLDESIPLTTNEFDEWGNPKQKAAYDYMLSYSPYDNVAPLAYPAIYVQTGLWDSQVQYFEPAKWVAKLRANKRDRNLLVLDIDMTSGHGGASGRFDRLQQTARALAFFLHVNGQPDPRQP